MDLHRLVSRIADALGPEADPARVEAVAAAALEAAIRPAAALPLPTDVGAGSVWLGLSLRDCASRLPQTVRARVYDKLRRTAGHLVSVADDVEARFGVRFADRVVAVTPIASVADGLSRDELIGLAQIMDKAALHLGVDAVAGFSALVEAGMTGGDRRLIEALPAALASTDRVCASVRCGTSTDGLYAEAVGALAEAIVDAARQTKDQAESPCARLTAFCNGDPAGLPARAAFHGHGEGEAALHLRFSANDAVLHALQRVGPEADLDQLFAETRHAAVGLAQTGERIGRAYAERLDAQTGTPVHYGSVSLSLDEGATADDLLRALGFEKAGAPGSTSALALVREAVRQGTLLGATSGIPASGPVHDVIAVPGDAPSAAIAGLLLDALTPGVLHGMPVTCRIIPTPGRGTGAHKAMGSPNVHVAIPEAGSAAGNGFVRRGGRFPAPVPPLHP